MQKLTTPGFYDLPMADYLADPCPEPSLSTGTIATLYKTSAAHAKAEHPRFQAPAAIKDDGDNEEATETPKEKHNPAADRGTAIHSLLNGDKHSVLFAPPEFQNWKTKPAQNFRNEAKATGRVALLEKERERVTKPVANALEFLARRFGPGKFEQTMAWQDSNGVWHRGRTDFLDDAGLADVDFKSVDCADARAWVRTNVTASDLDIQASNRAQGHETLGRPRTMYWLLIETKPPYLCRLVRPSQRMLTIARAKIDHASDVWALALKTGNFPGFGDDAYDADAPAYAELELAERTGSVIE